MGIAILTIVDLLMPLQSLASRFMPGLRNHAFGSHRSTGGGVACPPGDELQSTARTVERVSPHIGAVRPLRVVRLDAHPSGHRAGRVVISGRIADVCAELDRLAALEAAQAARLH